jgi:hypothetical protein
MLSLADVMHREGKIFLRPEYGRLDNDWPAIAFEHKVLLYRLQVAYTRGRDVVISTGTLNPKLTPEPAYRGKILAAAVIEPGQEILTRNIVPPSIWRRHCLYLGRPKWPNSLPVLGLYHLPIKPPYPDAKALIPEAYGRLSYRSGRSPASAILVTEEERLRLMRLPVKRVELTLSPAVIQYQEQLKARMGKRMES